MQPGPPSQPPPLPPEPPAYGPQGAAHTEPRALGQLLSDSIRMVKSRAGFFVQVLAIGLLPGYILSGIVGSATGISDKEGIKAAIMAGQWAGVGLMALSGIATAIFETMANIAVILSLDAQARYEEMDVKTAYAGSMNRFFPFFFANLRVTLWVLLGFILLIIPGVIWAIRYSMTTLAVLIENRDGKDALERSEQLMGRYMGKVIGNLLVVFCVTVLILIGANIVLSLGFGMVLGLDSSGHSLLAKLGQGYVEELVSETISVIVVAASVLLFRDLGATIPRR